MDLHQFHADLHQSHADPHQLSTDPTKPAKNPTKSQLQIKAFPPLLDRAASDRIDEALQRARALLVDLEHAREANAAHAAELQALAAELHAEEA